MPIVGRMVGVVVVRADDVLPEGLKDLEEGRTVHSFEELGRIVHGGDQSYLVVGWEACEGGYGEVYVPFDLQNGWEDS